MGIFRWVESALAYKNLHTGELVSATPQEAIYAGAGLPGSANYPVPQTNVMFVSPSGSNSNDGLNQLTPKQTLQAAMSAAPSGTTIVMRAGRYKESFATPTNKTLTVQPYPMEEVWLDGSAVYSSWTANGNGTWTTPYSVTFTRFDAEGYKGEDPYRNHPDQVWVDGAPLKQTADATIPAAGEFSVNQTADTLTIGIDPSGKTVRVSELPTALTVTAPLNLRGFGISSYSPQAIEGSNAMVFYGGTSQGSTIENMYFTRSAMASLNVSKADIRVSNNTFQDNGQSGIMGTQCHNLIFENNIIRRMNLTRWQSEPTTAGIKLTRCDNVHMRYNHMTEITAAYAIWFDVSATRTFVYGNTVNAENGGRGCLEIELSDGGKYSGVQYFSVVASNRFKGGERASVLLFDTGYVKVYNNDLLDSGIPLYLWQDERINTGQANNLTFEICPWRTQGIQAVNNHLRGVTHNGINIQLAAYAQVGDYGLLGANMFTRLAGTHFHPTPPGSMVQLGRSTGVRTSYNTLAALAAAGPEVGDITGKLGTNYVGDTPPSNSIADPLPSDIAALLGVTPGVQTVGPVTPAVLVRN